MGRPTQHTQELATEICKQLASGKTLRAVCKADDMPPESTVRRWVMDDREGFAAQYAVSREIGYQSMADELIDIADDNSRDTVADEDGHESTNHDVIARSRLRVDTRKWLLSKALPKVYGDKVALTGADGGAIKTETEVTVIELVAPQVNGEGQA
jgi:hypothetical protein